MHEHLRNAQVAVIMGVSGSGKTTIGRALAERLGWAFEEGDRLHPPANIAKMQRGEPLSDSDRMPWLAAIAKRIDQFRRNGENAVISCSALKRAYRDIIIDGRPDVRLVYLDGARELIAARVQARQGHFMPASLVDSQFATLEPPGPDEYPITVPVDLPVPVVVERLVKALSHEVPNVRNQVANLTEAS